MFKRLKELRKTHNLTQKDISNFLQITATKYSIYENGKTKIPISLLIKLAHFYNTSIDYIVEDTDEIIPYK